MASPSKCQHGLTTNTCTHCMTDELIQDKEGGILHIRPDGSMEVIKDGLLPKDRKCQWRVVDYEEDE